MTCMEHNTNSQIKFKIMTLKSRLCDYSDAYILVKGTITIPNNSPSLNADKKVIFAKLCLFYWLHKQNKQHTSR